MAPPPGVTSTVVVPPWARIGVDSAADRERYHVSAGGVTVLGKGARALV